MKGIKRLLAVVLTAALLATLVAVPVTAAELEDPLKLETIGILKGTGNGVDAAYRASVPTRYQAAWLFLRLLGKEAVAAGANSDSATKTGGAYDMPKQINAPSSTRTRTSATWLSDDTFDNFVITLRCAADARCEWATSRIPTLPGNVFRDWSSHYENYFGNDRVSSLTTGENRRA